MFLSHTRFLNDRNVAFFFLTKVVAVITLKIQIKTHLAALFVVLGDPRCE
ncbi:exosporium protein G [Bacillus sp. Xin]|nr:exosporium protein G [Bacillus sp. Xin]NSW37728.1 exosporium protein G [Bacillus sp. Xin1]